MEVLERLHQNEVLELAQADDCSGIGTLCLDELVVAVSQADEQVLHHLEQFLLVSTAAGNEGKHHHHHQGV